MGHLGNLTINGSGSYSGGAYRKIIVRGDGTITTDFECEVFKTFGTSHALHNAKVEKVDVFGETRVNGNLDCRKMKIFGTTVIGGSASIDTTKVFGTLEIGNRFSGEEADIKGSLSVDGDAEVEIFKSTGSFAIKGLLNAGTIEVSLRYGFSKVSEIGGERIVVKRKSSFLPFSKGEGSLEAHVIEGDEVFLENTKADIVRGKNVRIGAGCEIGVVEYRQSYKADPGSRVGEHRKLG
ncbi:cytoplasmic protein [Pseudoneobacillus sp. C159]